MNEVEIDGEIEGVVFEEDELKKIQVTISEMWDDNNNVSTIFVGRSIKIIMSFSTTFYKSL